MSYAFRPSAINLLLARIEKEKPELLPIALGAIREERDRWERGGYTDEEKELLMFCREAGERAAKEVDGIMLDVILNQKKL